MLRRLALPIAVVLIVVRCRSAAPTSTRVLWVGAHPDDEIFAAPLLYDLCVRQRASCTILALTLGERGACADPRGCGDLVKRRSSELWQSGAVLHASIQQWTLPDGAEFDPRDVLRRWSEGDCQHLLGRVRRVIDRATIVLTFDAAHGTSLHPDHRAVAMLVTAAAAAMQDPPPIYGIANRAEVSSSGTTIDFAATPPIARGSLVSDRNSWSGVVSVAQVYRSQFSDQAIARLRHTPADARRIVAAPVTIPPTVDWCAFP
jgi:LmbE family N-acetylglucosaminyl deacetylase